MVEARLLSTSAQGLHSRGGEDTAQDPMQHFQDLQNEG